MKGLKERNLLRLDKIVNALRKIAFVLIIAFTIVSIIGGIVMCTVDYLLAYGLALLFGGVIVGIITFLSPSFYSLLLTHGLIRYTTL